MTRPTKADRKKYDIDFASDLNFGLGMEDEVIDMFKGKKIEVRRNAMCLRVYLSLAKSSWSEESSLTSS